MLLILLVAVLAPFVGLVTRVVADPNVPSNSRVTLPIRKRFSSSQTSSSSPAKRDLMRSRNLIGGITNVPLSVDFSGPIYTAVVGVGRPSTEYELLIDTGSSNTWVGASKAYKVTNTTVETCNLVNITYGSGSMIGTEYFDTVTIAPDVAISGQSIGVASNSSGFFFVDGILGVGPNVLTRGTLIPDNTTVIPTVTGNLFHQGMIEQNLIAVSFEPTTSTSATTTGELTFGATDPSKFTGEINYVPLTHTYPASLYWGIDATLKYGNANGSAPVTILNTTAGIVDTGTTLLGLTHHAYNRYLKMTGAVFDKTTGVPSITPEQYNNLKSLFFEIGGVTYELNANAQIWPRALNTHIGGQQESIYLVVFDLGTRSLSSGTLDFIIGMTALQRIYSVFDTTNARVGLAKTKFTDANIN